MNCLRRHMYWQSKRFYWEKAPRWREVGEGNPGEQLYHMAGSLRFYGDGISFWVVFSESFWLRVLPGGAHLIQPRWMPERRILGGGRTGGVSLWPFLTSSGWWRLISSGFLTRTSCRKTAHASGCCGPWPHGRLQSVCLPWQGHLSIGFYTAISITLKNSYIYSKVFSSPHPCLCGVSLFVLFQDCLCSNLGSQPFHVNF